MSGNGVTPPGSDSLALVPVQNSPPTLQQPAQPSQQQFNPVEQMFLHSHNSDGRASLSHFPRSSFLGGGAAFDGGEGSSSYNIHERRKGRPRRYGPNFTISPVSGGARFSPPPVTQLSGPPQVLMQRPSQSPPPPTTTSAGLATPQRVQVRFPSQAVPQTNAAAAGMATPPQWQTSRPCYQAVPQTPSAARLVTPLQWQVPGHPPQAAPPTSSADRLATPPRWHVSGSSAQAQAATPKASAAWLAMPPQWQVSLSPPQTTPPRTDLSWLSTLCQLHTSRSPPQVAQPTTAAAWHSTPSRVQMPSHFHSPSPTTTAATVVTPSQVQQPFQSDAAPPTTTATEQASLSASKKRKAKSPVGSSNKKQNQGLPDTRLDTSVVKVKRGEDVSYKLMRCIERDQRDVCILSGNGQISNATIRQPETSGGTATYQGQYDIISLSGSFLLEEADGKQIRTGGLSLLLRGSDGRPFGGPVSGSLIAASPVQIIVGKFDSDSSDDDEPSADSPRGHPGDAPGAGSSSSPRPPGDSDGSGSSVVPTTGSTSVGQGVSSIRGKEKQSS